MSGAPPHPPPPTEVGGLAYRFKEISRKKVILLFMQVLPRLFRYIHELTRFLETGKGGMRKIASGENAGKIVGIQIGQTEAKIITPFGELTGSVRNHAFIRRDISANTDIYGRKIEFNKLVTY